MPGGKKGLLRPHPRFEITVFTLNPPTFLARDAAMYLTTLFASLLAAVHAARPGKYGYGRPPGYNRGPPGYGGSSRKPTTSCSTGSTCKPTTSVYSSTYRTPTYSTVTSTVYSSSVVTTSVQSTYYSYETITVTLSTTTQVVETSTISFVPCTYPSPTWLTLPS